MSPKRSEDFKAGRRDAILDAAVRLFVAQGYDRTTMREIAAEAGVSTGAIYVYFQTKAEMLRALCADQAEREREDLLAAIRAAGPGSDPIAVGLGVGFRRYTDATAEQRREHAQMNLLLQYEAMRDPAFAETLRGITTSWREVIAQLAREEQAAGRMSEGINLEALATLLIALPLGLEALELFGEGDTDWGAIVQTLGGLLRDGLNPARVEAGTLPGRMETGP